MDVISIVMLLSLSISASADDPRAKSLGGERTEGVEEQHCIHGHNCQRAHGVGDLPHSEA